MRADLAAHVAAAIARCEGPSLVFDRARIEHNLRALASAAREHRVTALFAAKSFPHPDVWALAAQLLDGFDAASAGELAALPAARVVSIVDPSGRAAATSTRAERVIVGCETVAQVKAAPAHAEISIRLSASLVPRDPAVGAVLDGSGHRRSRFGLDTDPESRRATLTAMVAAAGSRRVGVHVHHGPIAATSGERFAATAQASLTAARDASFEPAFVDVGGAWHAVADLPGTLAAVRAVVPSAIEVIVEPGRALSNGAGFATGHIVVARALADRPLLVADLSRICHLRWSSVDLVGTAPHPGTGQRVLVVGPTCFEEDVLGEWTIDPTTLHDGDRITLRDVSGYALAWNTAFGGVPPATVVLA